MLYIYDICYMLYIYMLYVYIYIYVINLSIYLSRVPEAFLKVLKELEQ